MEFWSIIYDNQLEKLYFNVNIDTHTFTIRLGESFAFNLSRSQWEWAGLLDIFVRFYCQGGANVNAEVKRAVSRIRSLQTEEETEES